jgi:hypothetical protein
MVTQTQSTPHFCQSRSEVQKSVEPTEVAAVPGGARRWPWTRCTSSVTAAACSSATVVDWKLSFCRALPKLLMPEDARGQPSGVKCPQTPTLIATARPPAT